MNNQIKITAIVEAEANGGTRSAVIIRHGDTLHQTPWLIGTVAKEAAVTIAASLREKFPDAPQTHVGFTVQP